ncbi:LuxR C-terminal-related transcriptional regulator [Streptomyces sp. NPDC087850]
MILSPREREIMTRLAAGLSVREVVIEMNPAEKTVRNH